MGFAAGSDDKKKNLPAVWKIQVRFLSQKDPLEKYSCLENPMDREAWRAPVHRVAKIRTRLSN